MGSDPDRSERAETFLPPPPRSRAPSRLCSSELVTGAPLSASPLAEARRLTTEGSCVREPDPDQVSDSLVAYEKRKDFLEISLNSHKAKNDVEPICPVLAKALC